MPLVQSASKAAISENISRLVKEGYPQKQATAIAYGVARKVKKDKRFAAKRKKRKLDLLDLYKEKP